MRKKVLILEDMETTRTALKRIVESCDDAITMQLRRMHFLRWDLLLHV